MISIDALKACSHKDLCQMAKRGGVIGWHAMRKDQLVSAIQEVARASKKTSPAKSAVAVAKKGARAAVATPSPVMREIQAIRQRVQQGKNLSTLVAPLRPKGQPTEPLADRVIVMVRDPYWLHIYWEIMRTTVERAEVALAQWWHTAKPVLRLLEVTDGVTAPTSERVVCDTEIHGGVSSWYLHVEGGVKSYRVEIGYLTGEQRFHSLARSNIVATPEPSGARTVDHHWSDVADHCDKVFALSGGYSLEGSGSSELQEILEERLKRPMGSPMVTRYGAGLDPLLATQGDLRFEIDAEIVLHGQTHPSAHVTMKGEPVKLRPDGTFSIRMPLPNQRQVIPAVACAANGALQRTVVVAVERNTKVMEPIAREASE